MPVSSRLFGKSVPGETQLLTHTRFSTYGMNASSTSLSCQTLSCCPFAQSPRCQHCYIFGFIVKFSCSTLLNGCCSTVILFKRECFVEAAPGYSSIHSSLLKPRLRTPPKSLFFPPLPPSVCACVVSWHSQYGGCCGFCSVWCSRNYVSYQVHSSLFSFLYLFSFFVLVGYRLLFP